MRPAALGARDIVCDPETRNPNLETRNLKGFLRRDGEARAALAVVEAKVPPTNPHDRTKLMVFRLRTYRVAPLDSEGMSIYSTNFYQGVNIPIFGNPSIARPLKLFGSTVYCTE